MSDLLNLSLTEIAAAIRQKKASAVEVTKACIARAERIQPKLNCFIALEPDEALRAARKADNAITKRQKLGPLHGVPLAHKDIYYRSGKVSTAGSKILRDYRATTTATTVERLYAAGAIWLGNLNMSEFAANPTGHNDHWGHCRNPWNPAHITGGSSSGSACAVAARSCYGALGSDTGGSVRLPAAACGVIGVKPTYGRVSRYGVHARAWSQDTVGVLARTARDCARILGVIAGADHRDSTCSNEPVPNYERGINASVKGLKIGVPENHFYDDIAPDVAKSMTESLDALKSIGAKIVKVNVPDPKQLSLIANTISICEAAAMHAPWIRTRPQDYTLMVRARIEMGYHIPATSYLEALSLRAHFLREFVTVVFGNCDVLHTPVLNISVPTITETSVGKADDVLSLIARLTRNSRPFNYLGTPTLSIPAGFSDSGLPVAFQLVGRPFAEALLFRAGYAYQAVTGWHTRVPNV